MTWTPARHLALGAILAGWFAVAAAIGTGGWLASAEPGLLRPIALGAAVPVLAFLAAYGVLPGLRRFVLAQDIATLTQFHHWRVVGFGFLLLYAHGVLPGVFAWPAGVGDVMVGLAAPLVVARLARDASAATSAGLVRFHLLGLADFAVAVSAASLSSGVYPALVPGGVTSAPMEVWPLSLFPTFIVPVFVILHLAVLLKVRALRLDMAGAAATAA